MSPEIVGIVVLIILFIFLFAGMPIGFGMALTGFFGFAYLWGFDASLKQIPLTVYSNVASFSLSVIPLFVVMGHFAVVSGVTEGAYQAANLLFKRLSGGLAIATIGACAGFAACSGSSIACAATMTKVALPEMLRYKYDSKLASGVIAAGGTLGILIPPSVPMIVYAIITEASIGKLFMAGILPGILLVLLFVAVIVIWGKLNPKVVGNPDKEKFTWNIVPAAAVRVWPVVLLAVIIMGGIWGGVFSPTEAGAIGAFVAFILAVVRRKLTRSNFISSLKETTGTTAMIFGIVIGAMIFANFITISGLPAKMVGFITDLSLPPVMVLIVIMVVYIFLGCIMDTMALTLITLPIIFPVIINLGYDPILFGILFTINMEMALITPPLGMNVFVIGGMTKDIPMYNIFRGAVPFVIALAACLALVIAFPEIALFLPNTMMN